MTVSALIVRSGIGPWSSIAHIITHGLAIGAAILDPAVIDRTYLIEPGAGTGIHKFRPTTPDGRPFLSVGFRKRLPDGLTILSAVVLCAVHESSVAADDDPGDRLDGEPTISDDGETVSQWFEGGVADVDYILTFLATYSDGQVEPVDVILKVNAYNNVGT